MGLHYWSWLGAGRERCMYMNREGERGGEDCLQLDAVAMAEIEVLGRWPSSRSWGDG